MFLVVCASITTFAPRLAQRTAMASPMPLDAPVTTTVRPFMEKARSAAADSSPSNARGSTSSSSSASRSLARRVSARAAKKSPSVRRNTSATSSFATGAAGSLPAPWYSSRLSSAEALMLPVARDTRVNLAGGPTERHVVARRRYSRGSGRASLFRTPTRLRRVADPIPRTNRRGGRFGERSWDETRTGRAPTSDTCALVQPEDGRTVVRSIV